MRSLLLISLSVMLLWGCGPVKPHIIPAPEDFGPGVGVGVEIKLGINGGCGYHGPLDAETLAHYNNYGRPIVCRYAVQDTRQLQEGLDAIAPFDNLTLDVLIEGADRKLVETLAPLIVRSPKVEAVELGNELDLAGVSPQVFSVFLQECYFVLRARGFTGSIISGGIYSLRSLNYLKAALENVPKDVEVGVHLYNAESVDIKSVLNVSKDRPINVTEAGCISRTLEDEQSCLVYLKNVVGWLKTVPQVKRVMFYQHTDGPGNTDLDRYGFRTFDKRWKLQSEVLR